MCESAEHLHIQVTQFLNMISEKIHLRFKHSLLFISSLFSRISSHMLLQNGKYFCCIHRALHKSFTCLCKILHFTLNIRSNTNFVCVSILNMSKSNCTQVIRDTHLTDRRVLAYRVWKTIRLSTQSYASLLLDYLNARITC